MTDRNKLIEILNNWGTENNDGIRAETVADYLIENGVIILPCKVGDTVYMPWNYNDKKGIAILEVTHIIIDGLHSYIKTDFYTDDEGFWNAYNGGNFNFSDIAKTVFLTFEAAEQALKERKV